jgi:hypothetical protein
MCSVLLNRVIYKARTKFGTVVEEINLTSTKWQKCWPCADACSARVQDSDVTKMYVSGSINICLHFV